MYRIKGPVLAVADGDVREGSAGERELLVWQWNAPTHRFEFFAVELAVRHPANWGHAFACQGEDWVVLGLLVLERHADNRAARGVEEPAGARASRVPILVGHTVDIECMVVRVFRAFVGGPVHLVMRVVGRHVLAVWAEGGIIVIAWLA